MAEGTVRWFDVQKGYGFIAQDGGGDVFVHRSAIEGEAIVTAGQRVTFNVTEDPRGKKADQVVPKDEFVEVPPSEQREGGRPRPRGGGGGGGGNRGRRGGGGGFRGARGRDPW